VYIDVNGFDIFREKKSKKNLYVFYIYIKCSMDWKKQYSADAKKGFLKKGN